MRLVKSLLVIFVGCFLLAGCKGSKDIQGTWYAVNSDNLEMTITFDEKTVTFSSEGQDDWTLDYVQTGTGFENQLGYKILEWDEQNWTFIFPDKKDLENAFIMKPYSDDEKLNGDVYWVLSKTDYPDYEQYKESLSE